MINITIIISSSSIIIIHLLLSVVVAVGCGGDSARQPLRCWWSSLRRSFLTGLAHRALTVALAVIAVALVVGCTELLCGHQCGRLSLLNRFASMALVVLRIACGRGCVM